MPIEMAFRLADDILRQGVQGISELITQPGLINVDFAHVRNLMQNGGGSLLTIGTGKGDHKAAQAVEHALHHPMLETINLENASGIIANFTGGDDLSFAEVTDALIYLQQKTNSQVEIVPGVICDNRYEDRAQVTLVITGIGGSAMDPALKFTAPAKAAKAMDETANAAVEAPAFLLHENAPTPVAMPQFEMAGTPADLDVPAFLRRRIH